MREPIKAASRLIDPLGTPEFFDAFYLECRSLLDNDQCNIFYFDSRFRPSCLFTTAVDARMRKITRRCASEYVSAGYRRDPTILAATSAIKRSGTTFVRHLRASEIFDPKYRNTYYSYAEVSQKISLASRDESGAYYINFYRNIEQPSFTSDELNTITESADLLFHLVAKHQRLTRPLPISSGEAAGASAESNGERQAKLKRRIRQAMLNDSCGLTEREADICAAIACGDTTQCIVENFGISSNTVSTHRKRAYAKLCVSSQAELFARYYDSVGRDAIASHS